MSDLGTIYKLLGQFEKAKAHFDTALKICHEIEDRDGERMNLGRLGRLCSDLGQRRKPRRFLALLARTHKKAGD